MIVYEPSEFISIEEARELLPHVLVLCPVYERPTVQTEFLIDLLRGFGCKVKLTRGVSEIASARNITAASAYEDIKKDVDETIAAVFWLDGDMTASPLHVAALCMLALDHDAAIAGFCCQRSDNRCWAAKRLITEEPLPTLERTARSGQEPSQEPVHLIPVYAGMACMAVSRRQFLAVCESVEWFKLRGQQLAPAICECRLFDIEGIPSWYSEDIYYSVQLWKHGGLYLAPIVFGHMTQVAALPAADGWFLNEKPES